METTPVKNFKTIELPGIKLLLVASALIFVFYIFLVYNNYSSDVRAAKLSEQAVDTKKLLGEIYLHNEAVASSAKLYVSTSIDTWQQRYSISKEKLKEAIRNVIEFLPKQEQSTFTAKLDEIGGRLEEIENSAFARVASGNAPEADSLLSASEYERNKNLYAASIKNLANTLKTNLDKEQRRNTFNKTFFNAVGALSFLIMVILAISAIAKTAKFVRNTFEAQNKKIAESEKEMKAVLEKQLETNEQLFLAQKQMQEKNVELEKAKQATEKLLREQEEANKKLALAQKELQKTLAEQNRTNQKLVEAQQELTQKAENLEKSEQRIRLIAEEQRIANEKLKLAQQELTQKAEALERSEREMRALAEAQLEANEQLFMAQRKAEEALKQEEKTKQELVLSAQKQDVLNKILQKSIATNSSNLKEFFDFTIDTLSEVRFLELLPGVGIFTKKSGDVYEMIAQKNISPKIQELCHNIKTGQCLCGLAIKTKETQYAHCVDERHTTRFEGIKEHGHYNVPILYQEEVLGALVVYLPHGHKKEQSEIDFLEAVCNIIANTIISVHKEQELEDSEREMRALAEAQLEANEQLFFAQRKMQEAQKELQRLSLVASKTDNAVIISDANGLIEWVNEGFERLTEYKLEEVKGKKPGAFLQGAETNPADVQAIREGLASRKPFYCEIYNYSKSGKGYWLGLNITPIFDESGNLTQFIAIETDITERKQAELEKQIRAEKLEKYNQILNKLSLTSYEQYGSLENVYKTVTEALAEGLGVERASVWQYTGESIISEDLYEKSLNRHSAGVELFAKDFPAYFEGVSSGLSIVAENAHKHPNTFEFSEVYLSPLGINSMLDVPIRIEGELKGVICCEYVGKDYRKWTQDDENFVRSVSDVVALFVEADKRKKAQEEIKELLEMQTTINDTLMLAQQELAQKADELERSEREARALAEAQLEANEKLMLAQKEAQEALLKAKKAEEEMRMLAEAQLEANERLMLAEKQLKETLELEQKQRLELDKLVAQLKDTQGQLVHNEKMASLGQLTAGIAHEINNPINFVYNGIDTLKVSLDDLMEIVNKYNELDNANGNKDALIEEAKQLKQQLDFDELTQDIEHLVADIKRGAVRTMEIVKGLRVFSRLDEEERKMASIKDCLDSTLILLNSKMKGRVELKKYYDESMPEIMCYPGQLNQVFMNIINNAIQAIPEDRKDGEISIYTENQQENVIIRIKDNGIGMSEQVKRRIFEPFFTTKPVGVGTGLGLSITFGIIEKHGGNIFVNSEEGKGTEFVIQLPKEKI